MQINIFLLPLWSSRKPQRFVLKSAARPHFLHCFRLLSFRCLPQKDADLQLLPSYRKPWGWLDGEWDPIIKSISSPLCQKTIYSCHFVVWLLKSICQLDLDADATNKKQQITKISCQTRREGGCYDVKMAHLHIYLHLYISVRHCSVRNAL